MLAFRLFDNKWLSFQIEELKTSAKRKRKDQKERKEGHGQEAPGRQVLAEFTVYKPRYKHH